MSRISRRQLKGKGKDESEGKGEYKAEDIESERGKMFCNLISIIVTLYSIFIAASLCIHFFIITFLSNKNYVRIHLYEQNKRMGKNEQPEV